MHKILGANIRKFRLQQKLTQEQAAENASLSPAYWGYLERGEKNPTLSTLIKIASSLNVEPAELLQTPDSGSYKTNDLIKLLQEQKPEHLQFLKEVTMAYIRNLKE